MSTHNTSKEVHGALAGIKVVDAATLFAGPQIATHMADFGAEVLKIEHPSGDAVRKTGYRKGDVSLWWKLVGRNKASATLNLSKSEGQDLFRRIIADADVVIENFRPGTMERWGLSWDELSTINPGLVMVRTTGFGQTGPYSSRPGFGTLAEAMSGFAYITGDPAGPPTLPPFGLADGIAALYGTMAVMFALYERDRNRNGEGQWIDLSLYEPMFSLLGCQTSVYDQLGLVQERTGNRSVNNAPRNTYLTKDDKWVAISTASTSIAKRVLRLVGGDELAEDPRFAEGSSRVKYVDELDAIVGAWIRERPLVEVLDQFEEVEAAIAPVYSIEDLWNDPHVRERGSIIDVADTELGNLRMQGVFPILSRTPGSVRHAGEALGAANHMLYREQLGLSHEEYDALVEQGVISAEKAT